MALNLLEIEPGVNKPDPHYFINSRLPLLIFQNLTI